MLRSAAAFRRPRRGSPAAPTRPAHADALAELLPVLLCGEESAALAMDHIAGSTATPRTRCVPRSRAARSMSWSTRRCCKCIRAAASGSARRSRRCMRRCGASSCDLRAVIPRLTAHESPPWTLRCCSCWGTCARRRRPIALEPTLNTVVARIHRDEARHVAVTSRYAAELPRSHKRRDDGVVETRHGLTRLLERRAVAMEDLGVDPDRLFKSLHAIPRALRL